MSKIILAKQASAPDTPGSGKVAVYADGSGNLAWKDDAAAVGVAADVNAVNTFSAAQLMQAGIQVGVAANALTRPAAGVLRQAMETTPLANGATLAVSATTIGFIFLNNSSDGALAVVAVAGAGGTLIYGSTSVFSGTAGTANRMNVYASGGQILIQNNLGATKTVSVVVLL